MYEFNSLLGCIVFRLLMCLFMGKRNMVEKITGNFIMKGGVTMSDTFRNLRYFLFHDISMCLWTGFTMIFIGWIFMTGFAALLTR